jgi:hypothetical protein
VLALPSTVVAQADHLEVLQTPQLVECDTRAFFRVFVSPVDADRKPIGVALSGSDPKKLFQVSEGERPHGVIYVASSAAGGTQGTYSILLLDTSGSMNARLGPGQTRFTVAKKAVRDSLANFADGTDHMAVIPFDSHKVVARIRGAEFQSTRRGLGDQLDAISAPQRNTAIFSAVAEALPILKERSDAGFAVSLVVFTDGKNEVNLPGDDRGLLGDEGLAIVRALAATMKIPITTVGFGVTGNVAAENVLKEIAWPNSESYYDAATSGDTLRQIFESARRKLTERIHILFGPVRSRRTELAGQSVQFRVRFRAADGFVTSRLEPLWNAPAVGVPVADTTCTTAEAKAILEFDKGDGPGRPLPWNQERLLILLIFAAILAGLWFGAPRLVWPESYIPRPTFQRPNVPLPPNVPSPSFQRPQMPSMSPPRAPAPPAFSRPSAPNEQTIVVPPRPQPRSAPSPPRGAPRAPEPRPRDAQDETVYRPPDKDPGKR